MIIVRKLDGGGRSYKLRDAKTGELKQVAKHGTVFEEVPAFAMTDPWLAFEDATPEALERVKAGDKAEAKAAKEKADRIAALEKQRREKAAEKKARKAGVLKHERVTKEQILANKERLRKEREEAEGEREARPRKKVAKKRGKKA